MSEILTTTHGPSGLTLRQTLLLHLYPRLVDGFLGEPVRFSMYEADALMELVDAELAGDEPTPTHSPVARTSAPPNGWGRVRLLRPSRVRGGV